MPPSFLVVAVVAVVVVMWSQVLFVQRPARLRAPALLRRLEDARAAAARTGQGRRCPGTNPDDMHCLLRGVFRQLSMAKSTRKYKSWTRTLRKSRTHTHIMDMYTHEAWTDTQFVDIHARIMDNLACTHNSWSKT